MNQIYLFFLQNAYKKPLLTKIKVLEMDIFIYFQNFCSQH